MNARQWMNAMMQSYAREHYAAGNSGDKTMSWDQAIANANAGIITDYLHYNIFDQPDNDLFNGIYLKNNAQIKSGIADDLDWFKAAIRSGFRQDYTLSGDGGNQMANYYFSAGYTKEDGYTKESGFERITGRASVNLNPKKWFKTGMTLAGSHQLTNFHSDNEDSYKNAFGYCRNIAPIYPIHLHDMATGDYMVDENGNLIYDSGDVNGRTQYSGRHYLWETELDMDKTYRNVMKLMANCNTEVTCFAPASVSIDAITPANVVTVKWAARTDLRPVVNNFELKYGLAGFDQAVCEVIQIFHEAAGHIAFHQHAEVCSGKHCLKVNSTN